MNREILKKIFKSTQIFLIKQPLKLIVFATLILFVGQTKLVFAASIISFLSALMDAPGAAVDTITAVMYFFTPEGLFELFFRLFFFFDNLIIGTLLSLAGWLFNESLAVAMTSKLDVIDTGWSTSLALVNNFFIFILLGIAIATILGIESFNYKKMLPKFIIVILLINFSLVIGGLIMDTTNFFGVAISNKIFTASTSPTVPQDKSPSAMILKSLDFGKDIKKIEDDFKKALSNPAFSMLAYSKDILITLLFSVFIQLVTIFIFLSGAAYMLTRTFWLWFLLMISPLAWLAYLIPGQEQQWKKWWSKFIAWSLFMPGYVFFLYLGITISTKVGGLTISSGLPKSNSSITLEIVKIIQILMLAFVMLMGTQIASILGVNANNFITNYAGKAKGAAAKKFKDMRGKSAWSAENIGTKLGKVGALASAPVSTITGGRLGTQRGKEIYEKGRQEKLEAQQKKELLYESKQDLKKFREGKKERKRKLNQLKVGRAATEQRLIELQIKGTLTPQEENEKKLLEESVKSYNDDIKEMVRRDRDRELNVLRAVRKAAGSEKVDFEKELKKLLEKSGDGAPPVPTATMGATTP